MTLAASSLPRYLKPSQVAERLGFTTHWVLRLIRRGSLRACRLGPKTIRINELDLLKYLGLPPGEHPPDSDASFVYFVQAGDSGPIKIGLTENLYHRFTALQVGNHEQLKIVGSRQFSNAASVEGVIHSTFSHLRIHGEWFRGDPSLLSFIKAVCG